MIQNNARLSQISSKLWKILSRNIKTKVEEVKKVKFTDTINLPKTKFPARLNQQQRTDVEEAIRAVSKLILLLFLRLILWIFSETFRKSL